MSAGVAIIGLASGVPPQAYSTPESDGAAVDSSGDLCAWVSRIVSLIERGVLAVSNARQVEKIVRIVTEMGHQIVSPAEAREILGLKGVGPGHRLSVPVSLTQAARPDALAIVELCGFKPNTHDHS